MATWVHNRDGTNSHKLMTHLPLVIDHFDGDWEITAEEGAGIILALQQRNRVRIQMVVPNSQKLIMAMDEECPVLDHLAIVPLMEDKSTALILSDTLQPPHLRFMGLSNSYSLIKYRRQTIFTTAGCFPTYEGHAQASFVRIFIAISNGEALASMGFTFGRGILMSTLTTYWASSAPSQETITLFASCH